MTQLSSNQIKNTRKNAMMNGNFDIWQRGVSFAVAAGASNDVTSADRWRYYADPNGGTTAAGTITRESHTLGQTDVPNEPTYFWRMTNTTQGVSLGNSSYHLVCHKIEGVRTFAGKRVILSFYARSSISSKGLVVAIQQVFGTGGSPSGNVVAGYSSLLTLTSSWQKFTLPIALSSIAGKTLGSNGDDYLQVQFHLQAGSSVFGGAVSWGGTGTVDIAQVQLEEGSVATQFEQRTIGEELALCQRYFEIHGGVNAFQFYTPNAVGAANLLAAVVPFAVPKRASPIMTKNGTWGIANSGQPSINSQSVSCYCFSFSSLAAGGFGVWPNSTDDTVTAEAEL